MYIDIEKVRADFAFFTGFDRAEAAQWDMLCKNGAVLVEKRLREGISVEEHQDRLCTAAASWAYGTYLGLAAASSAHSGEIKVGDITLKDSASSGNGGRTEGEALKKLALAEISDLIHCDRGVLFAIGEDAS